MNAPNEMTQQAVTVEPIGSGGNEHAVVKRSVWNDGELRKERTLFDSITEALAYANQLCGRATPTEA